MEDDFDFAQKLDQDLQYIKTYVTVDLLFQFHLQEIFDKEELHCITWQSDNGKIVKHDRDLTQYVCKLREIIKYKRFMWFRYKKLILHQYIILAEMQWDDKNHNKLSFYLDGYGAYQRLLKLCKPWSSEHEVFIDFKFRTPDNDQWHCEKTYEKYFWQKEFTRTF